MNSSSVTPPHRISRLAKVAPVRFFITYFTGRARLARRHSTTAETTCTTRETSRTTRMIQSSPAYGRIGSPNVRRWWAYSLNASCPPKALRLPYMCSSTKPMKTTPLIAINSLSAIVVRVERPCPTRLRWTAGWAVVAGRSFVATSNNVPFAGWGHEAPSV